MNTYAAPQQDFPKTTTNGQYIFMGAWEDGANDGSFEGIFAQRYELINNNGVFDFRQIGTATPSILLGMELTYPSTIYNPINDLHKVSIAILDTGLDILPEGGYHPFFNKAIW